MEEKEKHHEESAEEKIAQWKLEKMVEETRRLAEEAKHPNRKRNKAMLSGAVIGLSGLVLLVISSRQLEGFASIFTMVLAIGLIIGGGIRFFYGDHNTNE